MIVKITVLLCLAYSVSGEHVTKKASTYPPFKWPSEYFVEGTKRFESTGYTVHLKYWRSNGIYARIDVNDDVSRVYLRKGFGTKYEIYYKGNKTSCNKENGTSKKIIEPYIYLPSFQNYKNTGHQTIKGVRCVKFTEKTNKRDKNMFWAYVKNNVWVPKRYKKRSNDTHGSLHDHAIYDYVTFKTFVNKEVFNIYKRYSCTNKKSENNESHGTHSQDSNHDYLKLTDEDLSKEIDTHLRTNYENLESRSAGNIRRPYFLKETKMKTNAEQPNDDLHLKSAAIKRAIKEDHYPPLEWPTKMSIEAKKLYLTSGWTEHLKYWQFRFISRLDANNGAVTKIRMPNFKKGYRLDYEIHPETTAAETIKKVCSQTKKNGTHYELETPIDFLPITSGLKRVGKNENSQFSLESNQRFEASIINLKETGPKEELSDSLPTQSNKQF